MSNKALVIFISSVVALVLFVAFLILKPSSEESNPPQNGGQTQINKTDSGDKSSNGDSSKENKDESNSDKSNSDKPESEDNPNQTNSVDSVDSSEREETKAEIEKMKKENQKLAKEDADTKKRLDVELSSVSKEYSEKLTKAFEETEKEYLELKEKEDSVADVLNKFLEKKSIEIGDLHKEGSIKIINSEWANANSNYGDFDKFKKELSDVYDSGMEKLLELHAKSIEELIKKSKENTESEDVTTSEE